MSFALRFGAVASHQQSVWNALPRVPQISIRLGLLGPSSNPSSCPLDTKHNHQHQDSRLADLQEQLESDTSGEPPFMIDNGTILRAAPKKKMSYRRKRVKLYTPGNKQIQPLNNIVRCPACGAVKRSHFMCMNCFVEIRSFLKKLKRQDGLIKDVNKNPQSDLDPVDERVIYPGKRETDYERELKRKEWIPQREEALLFEKNHIVHKKK
ncbi:hypothetical protein KGF57_002269 [Candida theae]|uniref:Large ribosomal subunit protein bL32m n=1 Tax=Candida theae TaxID=1198502 RepID=A0AAD5BG01_9ASCO|nr:uncharacterized protein KGF57_002269 [Candida theae]KAI5958835.1 hypothetical protein KGF57_002269 [Candida theae]